MYLKHFIEYARLYFRFRAQISYIRKIFTAKIKTASSKDLIKSNEYLLKKYLSSTTKLLILTRKLLFYPDLKITFPDSDQVSTLEIDLQHNMRNIQLDIYIYSSILSIMKELITINDTHRQLILIEKLHKLNNKTYVYSLKRNSQEYQIFSKLEKFEDTDVYNILDILDKSSFLDIHEIENIKKWQDIQSLFWRKWYVKFYYAIVFITITTILTFVLSKFVSVWLLIPGILGTSLVILNNINWSSLRPNAPIRIVPSIARKSHTISVLIPIIYSQEPDYDDILKQVQNISNAEKNLSLKFFVFADESDTIIPKSENYWHQSFEQIQYNFDRKTDELKLPRINFLLREHDFNLYDQKYMGYERKRGKVEAFIKIAKGLPTNSKVHYDFVNSEKSKYLFILDEGMTVSSQCISQLLSILVHPINKPIIDNGRVISGFAIAQPKSYSQKLKRKTNFQMVFDKSIFVGSSYGEDSDIITNLSGSANFNGKGLVDMDIFQELLFDIFPENLVLSHDLLEGAKCRTVNDPFSKIFESYPSTFVSYLSRENRWMRGDINASLFALPRFTYHGKSVFFAMDNISRLRIVLNILNILRNIFGLIFLVTAQSFVVAVVTLVILRSMGSIIVTISSLIFYLRNSRKVQFKYILYATSANFDLLGAFYVMNMFVIYTISLSAVFKSIYRLMTGVNLLEWSTFKNSKSKNFFYMFEKVLILISLTIFLSINWLNTIYIVLGTLCFLWLNQKLSNMAPKQSKNILTEDERVYLKKIVIDTYLGLDRLFLINNNSLPLDNVSSEGMYDNDYTSITDIGLYLLTICMVHKLEIIDDETFSLKIRNTVKDISLLERLEGNFFNWYSISKYSSVWGSKLSSVDLGNFHISLICTYQYICKLESIDDESKSMLREIIEGFHYDVFFSTFEELSILVDNKLQQMESYYNIWASESRIASFLAVATEAVGDRHWYGLERLQSSDGMLKSWGGGSFEYLLPAIFFSSDDLSLEKFTYQKYLERTIVESESLYSNIPWGKSESIYISDDKTLEYGPNGVEGTGSNVQEKKLFTIAPYASALCIGIDLDKVVTNLKNIEKIGGRGEYGFFESISFVGNEAFIAKKYMSHHQSMLLLAISNTLLDNYIQQLFNSSKYGGYLQYLHNSSITQVPNIGEGN